MERFVIADSPKHTGNARQAAQRPLHCENSSDGRHTVLRARYCDAICRHFRLLIEQLDHFRE